MILIVQTKISALRILNAPMETPGPLNDTPGASKQVVLTPHDIPRVLRVRDMAFSEWTWTLVIRVLSVNSQYCWLLKSGDRHLGWCWNPINNGISTTYQPINWCRPDFSHQQYARWWFQIFFIYTPPWGNDPIWRSIFFKWVVQPPTRMSVVCLDVWQGFDFRVIPLPGCNPSKMLKMPP